VQYTIWPTTAKIWMSGHYLWTLICEVYFHKRRDLHSRCTNVCTKKMWKKIFCKKSEIQMSKQNNGCTSLSYQYQQSYLLQHSWKKRKENKWCTSLTYRHQHSYWYQHSSKKKPCQHTAGKDNSNISPTAHSMQCEPTIRTSNVCARSLCCVS